MSDHRRPRPPAGTGFQPSGARAERDRWSADLPRVVRDAAARWSLRLGPRFPGGSASWAGPVVTATGERAVLKVGWLHDEALHEADGLRSWDGRGAVRLLAAQVSGRSSILLIEACDPGTPLDGALPAAGQDVVIAGLLGRLWIDPPAGHPFRPLLTMCEAWAAEFERDYAAAAAAGRDRLDPGLARAGIVLLRELPATAAASALLCTDLHHGNVLAARREPWLMIDPKPYVGDPAYDVIQHMLNFPRRLAADPVRLAARMAGLLGLDRDRVRQWLFARCVQESAGDPLLRRAAVTLAP